YRCHPLTHKLVELLRQRVIGDVRVINATFSFHTKFSSESRLFKNSLGGGGILDVGCYCVSMARLIAGVASGRDLSEPVYVGGAAHLGETGVDEWAIASLRFHGDIVAELATGVAVNQRNVVQIFGSEGNVLILNPWVPARDGGDEKIIVHRNGETAPTEITVHSDLPLYGIEADTVAMNLERRQATSPAMSWDDSLGNMAALDRWRQAIGLTYEMEKSPNVATISRRPLAYASRSRMKTGTIAHLDKPVSRLIMGVDNQRTLPHVAVMFDDFFERGGNAFDTAFVYGNGLQEQLIGEWIADRGIRNQIVLIVKGAHTPLCDPENLKRQLTISLERLKTDHADIYLMHRDNLQIPAGEFVDVLNEQVKAGRIKSFGGSNWTTERIDEANAYAAPRNLQGFSIISNNFSLARMVQPIWEGCVSASDPASRQWFMDRQIALLAWSSQARGFFVPGVASPKKKDDPELVRAWYADDNFERQRRANELAERKNVRPINIALAYVLQQPFPTFALIGPRTLHETHTSLPGLDVELSPDELRYLNRER
ncbi:MAG: aldo/keto reductase, partial [Phycisphaerae bacterium]|nr:aldo/keto reductase [Phycisphaerae bacterium]